MQPAAALPPAPPSFSSLASARALREREAVALASAALRTAQPRDRALPPHDFPTADEIEAALRERSDSRREWLRLQRGAEGEGEGEGEGGDEGEGEREGEAEGESEHGEGASPAPASPASPRARQLREATTRSTPLPGVASSSSSSFFSASSPAQLPLPLQRGAPAGAAESPRAAARAAALLGVPPGANPYLYPQYVRHRLGLDSYGGSGGGAGDGGGGGAGPRPSLAPLPFPAPRSLVAAALDRLALPATHLAMARGDEEGVGDLGGGDRRSGEPPFSRAAPLAGQFDGVVAAGGAAPGAAEWPAGAAGEREAREVLSAVCRLLGVGVGVGVGAGAGAGAASGAGKGAAAAEGKEGGADAEAGAHARALAAALLPRVRALAGAAVAASSLHHFAGSVCARLGRGLGGGLLDASDGSGGGGGGAGAHVGLGHAAVLLDAALAELGALRRLHYAIGAEQRDEEVEAAAAAAAASAAGGAEEGS